MVAALGVGCSSKNEDAATATVPVDNGVIPTAPSGTTDGSSTISTTNTVDFVPTSFEEFNSYVATHPLNAPTNFKLTVDLTNNGGRYYGSVKLTYEDNGQIWGSAGLDSGSGTNAELPYSSSNGLQEYAYNVWFNSGGKYVFSGVFQDNIGAVVLVVDDVVSQADAQGGSYVSGSVWYRNFAQVQAPQGPYRKCWYITTGPYDCRDDAFIYKNSIYPTTNYRKLGTFGGLLKTKAFHD